MSQFHTKQTLCKLQILVGLLSHLCVGNYSQSWHCWTLCLAANEGTSIFFDTFFNLLLPGNRR